VEAALTLNLARLLANADASQAAFSRLAGVTARQVNNGCRGRAATPRWALVLGLLLQDYAIDDLSTRLEEAVFQAHKAAARAATRPAMFYAEDSGTLGALSAIGLIRPSCAAAGYSGAAL